MAEWIREALLCLQLPGTERSKVQVNLVGPLAAAISSYALTYKTSPRPGVWMSPRTTSHKSGRDRGYEYVTLSPFLQSFNMCCLRTYYMLGT
jgi:hypothetical protein